MSAKEDQTLTKEEYELVVNNVALAKFLARLAWNKAPEILDLEELTSLAYQGLVKAAQRYRPYGEEQGYSEESISSGQFFSVFARKRISGEILDWQRKEDHVQRSVRGDFKLLLSCGFSGQLNQGISIEKLSELSSLSPERIRKVIHSIESLPVSTEQLAEADHEDDSIAHPSADNSLVSSMSASVIEKLKLLSITQQVIIVLRYYKGEELRTIASSLDIPLATVRELHTDALLLLHDTMLDKLNDHL